MISSSLSKQEDVGVNSVKKRKDSFVPGVKPLKHLRFYLDVKNHITSSKVETKIKELGGRLELFLVKEVTHVITDREAWSQLNKGGGSYPRTPQTPLSQTSVAYEYGTPEGASSRGRPKTRADAMLERARQTPTAVAKDPLDQAKNWGITIWSLEKALIWLDKKSTESIAKKPKVNIIELKAPFIKFESFDRKHRPVFKEIRNWPAFNFRAPPKSSAIVYNSAVEQNMTRKSRAPQQRVNVLQSAYCEVCREEYINLNEHLESKKHLNFIKDNSNFVELDNLINDGCNIESFLNLHVVDDDKCDGLDSKHCSPLAHKMPRRRTSSISDKIKNSPISPPGSDSGHNLRNKRAAMTNNYIGLAAEEPEVVQEGRELRSSHRNALLKIAEQESDTWGSGRPKRSCIKHKRMSVDDNNQILEQRRFYKIESPTKEKQQPPNSIDAKKSQEHVPEQEVESAQHTEKDKSLVVKFRKLRTSELTLLNNEAEKFLFPKKDEQSSSGEDLDADGPETTISTVHDESSMLLSSEGDVKVEEAAEEKKEESTVTESTKKKKRLTQAEAFILDNKKYYKFEMPESRLRYHGTISSDTSQQKLKHNGGLKSPKGKQLDIDDEDLDEIKLPKKEDDKEEKVEKEDGEEVPIVQNIQEHKFSLSELHFSFESLPKSEPWYQTFSRQDQGEDYYGCYSDSGYWKPLLLPYEMGPITPLDPNECLATFNKLKKLILGETSSGTSSATCSTPDPTTNDLDLQEENSKDSTGTENRDGDTKSDSEKPVRRRKRRRGILMPSKNPRKSPRQHASTLAILSSLLQQRKKRGSELNQSHESRDQSLEAIQEADLEETNNILNSQVRERESSFERISRDIDEMFEVDTCDMEQLELCYDENAPRLSYKFSAIEVLEDTARAKLCVKKTSPRRSHSPRKRLGRKRKKNRTGWPKRSRRFLRREMNDAALDESVTLHASDDTEEMDDNNSTNCDDNDTSEIKSESDTEPEKCNNVASEVAPVNNTINERLGIVNINNDQSSTDACVNNKTSETNVQISEDRVNDCTDINNKVNRVADLDRWEKTEKVLSTKISNDANKDIPYEPYVRVKKIGDDGIKNNRRLRSSSSPHRTNIKRARRMPASPKSPRVLRKPRGRWYRER